MMKLVWTCLFAAALAAAPLPAAPAEAPRPTSSVDTPADAKPTGGACRADALGTSRTLVLGTKGGPAVGLKSYPQTLPLADHEVVLTFDDGPAATTPAILDALARDCVKATFFLIGRNAVGFPEIAKRERADGHTVGHHTFSHPARTLRRMTPDAAQADIDRGFKADDEAVYGSSGAEPRVPFFRFPGFADTKALDAWLAARNIAVFGTDIWAYDWLDESADEELGILMRQLDRAKKGIILLHDTRRSTARMVPALLRALKAGGYRIVHVVPGPGAAATEAAPPGWTSETDRIIAEVFARDSGVHHRPQRGRSRHRLAALRSAMAPLHHASRAARAIRHGRARRRSRS